MAEDTKQPGQTDDKAADTPKTGDAPGADKPESGAGEKEALEFTAEQQAHIDKLMKERLERSKSKWESEQEKAKEKAKADAERERLKEKEEFKTLAEKLETQVDELTPFKEQAGAYKGALDQYLEKERNGLPDHILALLEKMDVTDQLTWIADNKATVLKQPAPDINAGAGGRQSVAGLTDDEKREIGAKYHVDPQFVGS